VQSFLSGDDLTLQAALIVGLSVVLIASLMYNIGNTLIFGTSSRSNAHMISRMKRRSVVEHELRASGLVSYSPWTPLRVLGPTI